MPELHAQLLVYAIDFLRIDATAFTIKQNMNTPIAISDTSFTNLAYPLFQSSLIHAAGSIMKGRTVKANGTAGLTD